MACRDMHRGHCSHLTNHIKDPSIEGLYRLGGPPAIFSENSVHGACNANLTQLLALGQALGASASFLPVKGRLRPAMSNRL